MDYVAFDRGGDGKKIMELHARQLAAICGAAGLSPRWDSLWRDVEAVESTATECDENGGRDRAHPLCARPRA